MDKLQHLLETAFGQPAPQRPPQQPNDFTKDRQRAFEERAPKVEALRILRMAQLEMKH